MELIEAETREMTTEQLSKELIEGWEITEKVSDSLAKMNIVMCISIILTIVDDVAISKGIEPHDLMHKICEAHDGLYDQVQKELGDKR